MPDNKQLGEIDMSIGFEQFQMQDRPTTPLVSFSPPKPIVIVGLMGCGKSSIGKRLAKRFDIPFYDSDQEVEAAAGCSIVDIDDIFGDGAMESGEYRVINRLLAPPVKVIATGCFSFMNSQVRESIMQNSISVWLKANLDTLYQRVIGRKDRPMLNDGNERETIKEMMEEHYPVLEQANITVNTYDESTNITVDRVIIAISEYIRQNYPDYRILKSV